jgi:hypothetical protein
MAEADDPHCMTEADERSALASLFDKLSGDQWTRHDGWKTQMPLSDWYGVSVDSATGHINVLELSKNNLCGRLEDVVEDLLRLTHLGQLWLSENYLKGPLSSRLAERTTLTILDIGSNLLTGALSPAFSNSTTLTWFHYEDGNQLTSFWRGASKDNGPSRVDVASSTLSVDALANVLDTTASTNPSLWTVNTVRSMLPPAACAALIQEAEMFASARGTGGWSKSRHRDYSTTDVEVACCPALLALCNVHLKAHLLPTMAALFGFEISELGVEDLFVAKYDMAGQTDLREHRDGSELSFVLKLNDEYEGGGTLFRDPERNTTVLVRPEGVGDCVMFCGRHLHAGQQITGGVRYILTGFVRLYVAEDEGRRSKVEEMVSKGKRKR